MATADSAALDDFLNKFQSQVDSGFGLISGDVSTVFGVLVVISVGLTALLWAVDETQNVTAAFIRKILLVGFFAWLINNWHNLSVTIVEGFATLGLKAGSGGLSLSDFMASPSKVVADGFTDAFALVNYIGQLAQEGYGVGFFSHFDVILVAAVAAIGIILAFIILGVEIAVTIVEFHIVTLIGFVTVPFGILAQTAFMSERAIGYVVSVGVKLMALALVVSIGESVFKTYTVSADPTIPEECGLLLAAVVMLMLALKIPGIAGALISGGPQMSAGSAVAGAAGLAAGVGGAALAGRLAGGMIGRGVSEGLAGAAGKVSAAKAAAGAMPGARGGSDVPPAGGGGAGGGSASTLGASSSPDSSVAAGPEGAPEGGSAAGSGDLAEAARAFARAPVQSAVAAMVARGAAFGGAPKPPSDPAPPPPAPPSPAATVAAARGRGQSAAVVVSEAARAAGRAHEQGGGAGMTPTLHPDEPQPE